MKLAFLLLVFLHIFIWVYVLLAFLNPKTAYLNLYYVIPCIYILHTFPFHFINKVKQGLYPSDWEERTDKLVHSMGIPGTFVDLQKSLEEKCFQSPISPQGMLLFGAITSALVLKNK